MEPFFVKGETRVRRVALIRLNQSSLRRDQISVKLSSLSAITGEA
jgi:hypothetical protein